MTSTIVSSLRELADKIETLGDTNPLSTASAQISFYLFSKDDQAQVDALACARELFPSGSDKPDAYFFGYECSVNALSVEFSFRGEAVGEKIEEMRPVTVYRAKA